ncbi:unnamed protein product [Anisakis simplex]|uniref:BAT2_N domain-containing protein n=1 Tax=Anisakis simplex TaxID=6269 RepID=A0A158PPJ8_ANISI|nr:unnamed protein product [Anisakis simplex]
MSSARGAAGAIKPKLHNVNSIYAGKNQNAVKAPGSGKHGGLQSLGKTTAVVRRMPPPATLPSLRAESQGQDPNVALVPQGGTGWHKDNAVNNAQSSDLSGKSGVGQLGSTLSSSGGQGCAPVANSGTGTPHGADLRPTWAKQPASQMDSNQQAQTNTNAVTTASARDFPSLAAATATSAKQPQTFNDSLKPQKSGSWRAGGSSAVSKNDGNEPLSPPQMHSAGGYPAATAPVRNIERQPPPPQPLRGSMSAQSMATGDIGVVVSRTEQENAMQQKKDGLGDGGYQQRTTQNTIFDDARGMYRGPVMMQQQQMGQMNRSNDVRSTQYGRGESFEGRDWRDMDRSHAMGLAYRYRDMGFDESQSTRNAAVECDWQNAQQQIPQQPYRNSDREMTHQWTGAPMVSGPQDVRHLMENISPNAYGRERDDERQNLEREAAIERSRQKRRQQAPSSMGGAAAQQSMDPDGMIRPSGYGSVRMMAGSSANYEVDASNVDWDQQRQMMDDMYRQDNKAVPPPQRWGGSRQEDYGDVRGGVRREDVDLVGAKPEYRMLRRPESKESGELPQQMSRMMIGDEMTQQDDDEEDELQLTKLSRPAAKIIKRVAPGDSNGNVMTSNSSQSANAQQTQQMDGISMMPQSVSSQQGSQPSSRSSPSLHNQRASTTPQSGCSSVTGSGASDKRFCDTRNQGHSQRSKRYENSGGTIDEQQQSAKQNQSNQGRNQQNATAMRGGGRMAAEDAMSMMNSSSMQMMPQPNCAPALPVAPPPANNIWEKRAEERESAERERAATQRDTVVHQLRLQQQFPAVGEQPQGLFIHLFSYGNGNMQMYDHQQQQHSEEMNDYYGQEDEEYNGVLFRGQREFVNSRVSNAHSHQSAVHHHRSSRGLSLSGARGGARGYMRGGAFTTQRRGTSMPHQTLTHNQQSRHNYNDRLNPRRSKRHDQQQPLQEEDNFANMGEFHVEDTYECIGSPAVQSSNSGTVAMVQESVGDMDEGYDRSNVNGNEQHRPQQRQTRSQRSNAGTARSMGRGGRGNVSVSSRGGASNRRSDTRNMNTSSMQNSTADRGKRKKEQSSTTIREEDEGIGVADEDENGGIKPQGNRSEQQQYRRGGRRTLQQQQQMRHRRGGAGTGQRSPSGTHQNTNERGAGGQQLKSPVTSEGHEEWATASESSDVADKQQQQPTTATNVNASKRRIVAASKYGATRRMTQRGGPQRRDNHTNEQNANNNDETIPATNNQQQTGTQRIGSKNAKPASTTSHTVVRSTSSNSNAQPSKEEMNNASAALGVKTEATTTTNQTIKREACKDGLAGVDINNAGVIVIDDRPDDNYSIDNDDFEEVLSKKSKKLRQQQINEQIEAIKNSNGALQRSKTGTTTQNDAQNTLNTTVWNSSIVKEHNVRQSSPPLEKSYFILHYQFLSPFATDHPVIPSPIARPTPKTSVSSTTAITTSTTSNNTAVGKGVDVWAGPDDEQTLTTSKKLDEAVASAAAKKNSVEFAASFNSPSSRSESAQYDFTFDPSLQDESQPLSSKSNHIHSNPLPHVNSLKSTTANADKIIVVTSSNGTKQQSTAAAAVPLVVPPSSTSLVDSTLDANDLKQRLDKVKDFWPGQQQFSNTLLVTTSENGPITSLVNDKSTTAVTANAATTSSLTHAPNVAKVRPQPQTNDQSSAAPLKENVSCTSSAPSLPPPSPIACIPPGAYLQSLSQVPPPAAALTHYSMIFGEPYNPHSATSSPAQTLFGNGVSVSQAPGNRSRPTSFIDQSQQLFIHPPPNGTTPSSLTWSNGNPQIELLAGINATPPLPSQPGSAVQRFQFSSQPRSGSAFSARAALLNGSGKLLSGPPPPPPHIPPPLHPPHGFIAPPPDFVSLPANATAAAAAAAMGGVSTNQQQQAQAQQRNNDITSQNSAVVAAASNAALPRSAAVGVLGQLPPPHLQQQLNFPSQSQSGFTLAATGSFSQAPPIHAFTAPPPPLRYPPVVAAAATLPNDVTGVLTAGWTTKPSVNAFPLKYTNGGAQAAAPIGTSSARSATQIDRWTAIPVGVPPQYANALVFQSAVAGKENAADVLQANIEQRFQSSQRCTSAPRASSADENVIRRNSTVSSVAANNSNDTAASAANSIDNSNQQKKATKV